MKERTKVVCEVLSAFGLGEPKRVDLLGGTATQKYAADLAGRKVVVRVRPVEFCEEGMIRFDHAVMERLAKAGLGVPCPLKRFDGASWYETGGQVYEVLSWVEGEPFREGDVGEVRAAGRFLGRFHQSLQDKVPPGKEGFVREDHPDLLMSYANELLCLACDSQQVEHLGRVREELGRVKGELDSGWYVRLPATVIHGDYHPGNVRFKGGEVSAVYDYDYVSRQGRARDVSDGLMFFAGRRGRPFHTDNIYDLTQAFELDGQLCECFIRGYQETDALADEEWSALSRLIRSRWLQMRLRGSRKVPKEERVNYVLESFFDVIEWLDRESESFFKSLRDKLSG